VRENRSHGSVGEPVGNCRLYPDLVAAASLDRPTGAWVAPPGQKPGRPNVVSVPIPGHHAPFRSPH